jgi:hypothetical protein
MTNSKGLASLGIAFGCHSEENLKTRWADKNSFPLGVYSGFINVMLPPLQVLPY